MKNEQKNQPIRKLSEKIIENQLKYNITVNLTRKRQKNPIKIIKKIG